MPNPPVLPSDPSPTGSSARVATVLAGLLPQARCVMLAWRDLQLGIEDVGGTPADSDMSRRAHELLDIGADDSAAPMHADASGERVWRSEDGLVRFAAVWRLDPVPEAQAVNAWQTLLQAHLAAVVDTVRQHARIEGLEKSKRLQQALYEIADLAGAGLDLRPMLARIHQVVGTLMYVRNMYIVEYDVATESMCFLYFADEKDTFAAPPDIRYASEDFPNSLTFALLRRGQAMNGPSDVLLAQLGIQHDPATHGPASRDWLGVPMLRDGQVAGAIVVQSYDEAVGYSEQDRALLSYVAQHVLTAMDRRMAKLQLERRVEERTRELQQTNQELQDEVAERRRAEHLQMALFRISELAMSAETLQHFYAEVHAVVGGLLDARNFYISVIDENGEGVEFPYSVDEYSRERPSRRFGKGLTEYIIAHRCALLADRARIEALVASGDVAGFGARAHSWLGVPLFADDDIVGAVVVQSYSHEVSYTIHDQRLLAFVAHHIGSGLARQRGQQKLRQAHAELEQRVDERTHELANVNEQLRAQIGERLRAEQRLTYQALHDALTGLPNRAHLLDRLAGAIDRALRGDGMPFAVLFLDLDRFKLVNDSVGHAAGDRMLVEVATRIVSTVRSEDVVARLGGDEFALLVECPDGLGAVHELAQRIQRVLGQPMWVAGRELFPSGSLGIAMWHDRYRNGEELLRDADAAMYRAKSQPQNRCAVFDEAMREEATRSLDLEADMRRSLNSRHFRAFYQPIVRLRDGELIGHEALLRWEHETRGLLLPSEFIHLGEDSGLIEQVDWQLYEQVIEHLARGGKGYVSVNVSPRHFRSPGFADRLLEMVEREGADPRRLRVEITEVALLDDEPSVLKTLRALQGRGVLIQLDDFGTGYSALSYLHRFPISALKIDQSFVAGLQRSDGEGSLALIRSIVALAQTLGIETVGEGIETPYQREVLRELGCDYGQGFLLGTPRPVSRPAAAQPESIRD